MFDSDYIAEQHEKIDRLELKLKIATEALLYLEATSKSPVGIPIKDAYAIVYKALAEIKEMETNK